MPINGEYTWSETTDKIEISIPLKGVSIKKVDVFTTCKQLKVSYSPFLLDLNLFNDIDEDRSRAVLKNGTLKISLPKKEAGHWDQLAFESKQEIQQRRAAALKEREEKVKRQDEQLASKKVEEERRLTRQHMALEERERQRIDDIKAAEKKKAEEAMHKTFAAKAKDNETEKKKKKSDGVDCGVSTDDTKQEHPPQDCIDSDDDEAADIEEDLPPPRTAVQTSFTHTPRLFKTPSRESTVKQEKEFIMKNRDKNLKKNALLNVDDDADVDPAWLNSVNSKVEKSIANARKD